MAKDQMCKHLLEKPTAGNRLDITCLNLELHAIFFFSNPLQVGNFHVSGMRRHSKTTL